jgi:hypothetical protein
VKYLKHLKHTLLSQHLLAEIAHRGSHGVDSGHDLLVGNDGVSSTSETPRRARGMGHGAAMEGAWRGMERTVFDRVAARHVMGCVMGKTAAANARHKAAFDG